jgi:VTC domain
MTGSRMLARGGGSAADEALSPSLRPTEDGAAYELKFLLGDAQARAVAGWARQHLALDPHADPALADAYRIHSLYFDTAHLDVYHRAPNYKRRKFRLRRYGSEPLVYLERKSKWGDRVAKRRSAVAEGELPRLAEGAAGDIDWPGHWFQHSLLLKQLQPRCRLSYDRLAFVGSGDGGGPVRLTLDSHIHCAPVAGWVWQWHELPGGLHLLPAEVILELKFRSSLPALFKRLIESQELIPSPVSKYRRSVDGWGLANGTSGRTADA